MIGGQVVVLVVLTGVGSLVPDSIMPQITCMVRRTLIHRAPKIIILAHRHSGHKLGFSNLLQINRSVGHQFYNKNMKRTGSQGTLSVIFDNGNIIEKLSLIRDYL